MPTPLDLADRLSSRRPVPLDVEVGLAELLELFAADETADETPDGTVDGAEDDEVDDEAGDGDLGVLAIPVPRRSLRESGARLREWVQDSSHRAAAWGAVPTAADLPQARVALEAAK